jgi:hypothetical protein
MKLPITFPNLVITDNSVQTLQRVFQDLTRSLQAVAGSNNFPDNGPSSKRPTAQLSIGQIYFDMTLDKPVWWNGIVWVDATGATV